MEPPHKKRKIDDSEDMEANITRNSETGPSEDMNRDTMPVRELIHESNVTQESEHSIVDPLPSIDSGSSLLNSMYDDSMSAPIHSSTNLSSISLGTDSMVCKESDPKGHGTEIQSTNSQGTDSHQGEETGREESVGMESNTRSHSISDDSEVMKDVPNDSMESDASIAPSENSSPNRESLNVESSSSVTMTQASSDRQETPNSYRKEDPPRDRDTYTASQPSILTPTMTENNNSSRASRDNPCISSLVEISNSEKKDTVSNPMPGMLASDSNVPDAQGQKDAKLQTQMLNREEPLGNIETKASAQLSSGNALPGPVSHMSSSISGSSSFPSNSISSNAHAFGNATGKFHEQDNEPIFLPHDLRVNRTDLVRLIVQSLYSLNYPSIARSLQEESGIQLFSNPVNTFRNLILQGKYSVILENPNYYIRETFSLKSDYHVNRILLHILKQQYLELLESNQIMEALKVLRDSLTPRLEKDNAEELHQLASLLLCTNKKDLQEQAKWSGAEGTSRLDLIDRIQKLVDPQLLIPENRLETLLIQASEFQREKYILHHDNGQSSSSSGISLLQREIEPHEAVPDTTYAVLKDHTDEVWSVQFSHNGKMLASAGKDATCFVYDIRDFSKPILELKGQMDVISTVLWSPNDKYILTSSLNSRIRVWRADDGECVAEIWNGSNACAWLPNSEEFLYAAGSDDKRINKYNMITQERQQLLKVNHPIQDMDLSADGKRLVIVNRTKKFQVFNMSDMKLTELEESDFITSVRLSPCGRYAILNISLESSASRISRIDLWDLETKRKMREYVGHTQSKFVIRSCFGGTNGCFIVSGSENNEMLVWLRHDGSLLTTFSDHTAAVCGVACNPVYTTLFASASDDHTVRVYHCSKNPFTLES